MNHSKSEFRSKDLRSRTNNVGLAFQPADGGCKSLGVTRPPWERGLPVRSFAPPRPLTLALSPNTENVPGEREKTRETATQGVTSGSCRRCRPGLQAGAPLGLYREEAASCRFTNVQSPGSMLRIDPGGIRDHPPYRTSFETLLTAFVPDRYQHRDFAFIHWRFPTSAFAAARRSCCAFIRRYAT